MMGPFELRPATRSGNGMMPSFGTGSSARPMSTLLSPKTTKALMVIAAAGAAAKPSAQAPATSIDLI